jgi:hypothetical protein
MERVEYDGATGVLEVELRGELYRFGQVPIDVYEALRSSLSPAEFFEREIRGRYPYEHVAQSLPADL